MTEVGPPPRWLATLVRWTDDQFVIPGTRIRFGLDAILGTLLPGVGDAATALMAFVVVAVAWREGAPPRLLLRMMGNIAVDVWAGSLPVVGDWFDLTYRANRKNYDLLVASRRSTKEGETTAHSARSSTHPARPAGRRTWLVAPLLVALLLLLVAIPVGLTLLLGYWLSQ